MLSLKRISPVKGPSFSKHAVRLLRFGTAISSKAALGWRPNVELYVFKNVFHLLLLNYSYVDNL